MKSLMNPSLAFSDLLRYVEIDGNNFGLLIQKAGTISEYRTISKELKKIMEDEFQFENEYGKHTFIPPHKFRSAYYQFHEISS
ncbi:MAG: hypothetical protein ACTSRC_21630 [Candidatus Helarchaeota archaeon]